MDAFGFSMLNCGFEIQSLPFIFSDLKIVNFRFWKINVRPPGRAGWGKLNEELMRFVDYWNRKKTG